MTAFFESESPVLRLLGPSAKSSGGMLVETTPGRAVSAAILLGLERVFINDGVVTEVITDRTSGDYGSSQIVEREFPSKKLTLMESEPTPVSKEILRKIDSMLPPLPGAIDYGDYASLDRAAMLVLESGDGAADDVSDTDTETPPSDESLWDGATDNYELDEQDWEALKSIAEGGSADDLTEQQRDFLTEAGMLSNDKLTEFATEWMKR